MSSVRRTFTVLVAALAALVVGSTPALAGPAPLIEPEPAPPATGGAAGTELFDGLLPVVLVVLAVVLVAIAGAATSRIQHRRQLPTTA